MASLLLVSVFSGLAYAGDGGADISAEPGFLSSGADSLSDLGAGGGGAEQIEAEPAVNPVAAEELPHTDLARPEAEELLWEVFGDGLEATAAFYDELNPESFRSNYIALVPPTQLGDDPGLLTSLLPLRAKNEQGQMQLVDLNLELQEDHLEPDNPLVPVEIPLDLSAGISLPDSDTVIQLADEGSDPRASEAGNATAFFPNLHPETDLVVSAVPTGVEIYTHLRSAQAPTTETYDLALGDGGQLQATEDGGAEVRSPAGEVRLSVPPPTAIDAEGNEVPVHLHVSGSSIVVTADPPDDAAYPILVDPMFETYYWALNNHTDGISDWVAASNSSYFEARPYGYGGGEKGLNIYSYWGTVQPGAQANWNYHVPRFYTDFTSYGVRPTSFINRMTLSGVNWWIENESAPFKANPFVIVGLWDSNKSAWAALGTRTGIDGQMFNATLDMLNPNQNTDVKEGGIAMHAAEDTQSRPRHLWVGQATVEVSDKDTPSFGSIKGPSKWVDEKVTEAIDFSVSDPGLGVSGLLAKAPQSSGGIKQWDQVIGCVGNYRSPCPRTWKGGYWNYEPKVMPQGEIMVEMIGKDPIGHFSDQAGLQAYAKVKVDHSDPVLAVSGPLTDQATLGTWLPSYLLKYTATDGTEAAPRSGVVKTVIKVDEVQVYESSPGCSTRNCSMSGEWTMSSDKFSPGPHTVAVISTDGVGRAAEKLFSVETHGDLQAPSLALSGTMTEQANLGTTRPTYKLKISATDPGSTAERKSGVSSTSIKVDGVTVDSSAPGCPAGGCSISREWTLNSSTYPVGSHLVEVKATDGAGRSTTKTLSIKVERDTVAPELTLSGTLPGAPEGWVQQEVRSAAATATDPNGYGVKRLTFSVDAAVVGESNFPTCAGGGCSGSKTFSIDMTGYSGGAHPSVVAVEDFAGNIRKKSWIINVDPDGHISASEAEDTLEALDGTSPVNTLGPSQEEDGLEGTAVGLAMEDAAGGLVTTGGANVAEVSKSPGSEALISVASPSAWEDECDAPSVSEPEGGGQTVGETVLSGDGGSLCGSGEHADFGDSVLTSVELVPTGVAPSATTTELSKDEVAGVSSNVSPHVDFVTRPLFDGLLTFAAIRDAAAVQTFSWEVNLEGDQELTQTDPSSVSVFYKDGPRAFVISAVPAHDAVGSAVPTTLTTTGANVVTLTVPHRSLGPEGKPYVYPVVAGAGWEGGFQTYSVVMPPPEEQQPPEEEGYSTTEKAVVLIAQGPPVPEPNSPQASVLKAPTQAAKKKFKFVYCKPHEYPHGMGIAPYWPNIVGLSNTEGKNPPMEVSDCSNPAMEGVYWKVSAHGWFHFVRDEWVWIKAGEFKCDRGGEEAAQFAMPRCAAHFGGEIRQINGAWVSRQPIKIMGNFRFPPGHGEWELPVSAVCFTEGGVLKSTPNNILGSPTQRPMIWEKEAVHWTEHCNWPEY